MLPHRNVLLSLSFVWLQFPLLPSCWSLSNEVLQSVFFLEFNLYNSGWHVFSLVSVSSLYSLLGSGSVDHVISCVSCLRTSPQRMAKSVTIINSYLFLYNCHLYQSDSKHHFFHQSIIIIIINDYLMSTNYNNYI